MGDSLKRAERGRRVCRPRPVFGTHSSQIPRSNRSRCPAGPDETGTVVWRGGADLAPDPLYERVRTGTWHDQNVAA